MASSHVKVIINKEQDNVNGLKCSHMKGLRNFDPN
jgi:hypothetical protein